MASHGSVSLSPPVDGDKGADASGEAADGSHWKHVHGLPWDTRDLQVTERTLGRGRVARIARHLVGNGNVRRRSKAMKRLRTKRRGGRNRGGGWGWGGDTGALGSRDPPPRFLTSLRLPLSPGAAPLQGRGSADPVLSGHGPVQSRRGGSVLPGMMCTADTSTLRCRRAAATAQPRRDSVRILVRRP